MKKFMFFLCDYWISYHPVAQKDIVLTVHAVNPWVEIKATMWGTFFENINFGADDGFLNP